jgi:hypothetical protein
MARSSAWSIRKVGTQVSDNLLFLRRKPATKFVAFHDRLTLGFRQQAQALDLAVHYRTARLRQLAELAQTLADNLLPVGRKLAEGLVMPAQRLLFFRAHVVIPPDALADQPRAGRRQLRKLALALFRGHPVPAVDRILERLAQWGPIRHLLAFRYPSGGSHQQRYLQDGLQYSSENGYAEPMKRGASKIT